MRSVPAALLGTWCTHAAAMASDLLVVVACLCASSQAHNVETRREQTIREKQAESCVSALQKKIELPWWLRKKGLLGCNVILKGK